MRIKFYNEISFFLIENNLIENIFPETFFGHCHVLYFLSYNIQEWTKVMYFSFESGRQIIWLLLEHNHRVVKAELIVNTKSFSTSTLLYLLWTNAFALRPIWHYASAIFYSTFKSIKFVTRGWIFPCYKNFQCSTLCSLPFDPTTSKPIPCIFPHYTCICEQDPSAPLMCSLYSLLTSQSIPPLWYWDSRMVFLWFPG